MKLIFMIALSLFSVQAFAIKFNLPKNNNKTEIKVSRFSTGYNDSPEALVMESGKLTKTHRSSHSAFFLQHPKGNLLVDTGLGLDIDSQFDDMSWWAKPLFSYEKENPISNFLPLRIDGILITHLHWDHASGIEDFLGHSIYVDRVEYDSAHKGEGSKNAYLENQFDSKDINWKFFKWTNMNYGPFKKYLDYFGDGSLIVLPLYGHSKGSVGFLINRKNGERFFILGDAVWHADQVKNLKKKMYVSSILVDTDREKTYETIKFLNKVWKNNKDIKLLPNHHYDAIKFLPLYPNAM